MYNINAIRTFHLHDFRTVDVRSGVNIMKRLSIRNKISAMGGACVLVTALIIILYSVISMRGNTIQNAMNDIVALAAAQGTNIESRLKTPLETAKTLARTLAAVKDEQIRLDIKREGVINLFRMMFEKNPLITGAFTCWEPNGFDSRDQDFAGTRGHDQTGRFAFYIQREGKGTSKLVPLLTDPAYAPNGIPGNWYTVPKKTMKWFVSDPFERMVQGRKSLIITLTAPIIANDQFYGIVGVTVNLDFLQAMTDALDFRHKSEIMAVIGNDGTLAAVTGSPDLIGKHMKTLHPDYKKDLASIKKGEKTTTGSMGDQLEIYMPFNVGDSDAPWSINFLVPKKKITSAATVVMWKMIGIGMACVLAALVVFWLITGGIVGPIAQVVKLANAISKGDLSQRLNMNREDEIGAMAAALDESCDHLSEMISQLKSNADTQAAASEEMASVSSQMAAAAEEMRSQSDSVAGTTEQMSTSLNSMASAAEEMSVNIQSISSTAEEMSQNMNSVASSIVQMSTSIEGMAMNVNHGTEIAGQAMEMSDSATQSMEMLGKTAREIGEVTNLIKRIADQTNLLALNATIEAASAGDAGKGFAVVANEIKELAKQSGQAANDIAQRIQGVQDNTEEAVEVISGIADIIKRINESSILITQSVEEQSSTANEISGNVQQANTGVGNIASSIAEVARGANDMSKSVAEGAMGVNEVSTNIQSVNKAANESNTGALQVQATAEQLTKIAAQIQEMVEQFKV